MTTPGPARRAGGVLDLSAPIRTGMPVYPGDPEVARTPALTLEEDGVAVERLVCGSHTGTHVDAPCHSIAGGRTTSEIALEELIGPTLVVHLDAAPGEVVSADRLERALAELRGAGRLGSGEPGSGEPPRVLLAFGWDRHVETDCALHHPALSAGAAELLWSRGARVLGTDALSPDPTAGAAAGAFPVHELILGRDGLIVENLRRLRELPPGIHRIGIFPLPLDAADGAPVRAAAWPRGLA